MVFGFIARVLGTPYVKKVGPSPAKTYRGRPNKSSSARIRRKGIQRRDITGPVEPMRLIEEARLRADLTVYGLATMARIDQSYLRRLLDGQRRNPGRDTLVSIGESLMHYDERFRKKDLEKVLSVAGMINLPKNWKPSAPASYNPRSRARGA